jgi:hypothetical protein
VPAPEATATVPPPRPATQAPSPAPQENPVETDEAAIRRLLRSYERAIETKDLTLYRTIRPGLTATEETVLRRSFQQVASQEVDITVQGLTVDGNAATARVSRQDTLVIGGRRQTQNSTQTMRFARSATGWVIAD